VPLPATEESALMLTVWELLGYTDPLLELVSSHDRSVVADQFND
jgi:hypothetical protein